MGIDGGPIVSCTFSCGTGAVSMWVDACTLGSGAGTGDGVGVAVRGRGEGAGLGAGWAVAWRIIYEIWM